MRRTKRRGAWRITCSAPGRCITTAFYAKRWNGRDYPDAALFTLQSVDDQGLSAAARVRVFRGFGDPKLVWGDATHEVRGQAEIGPVAHAVRSAPVRPVAYEEPGPGPAATQQNGPVGETGESEGSGGSKFKSAGPRLHDWQKLHAGTFEL